MRATAKSVQTSERSFGIVHQVAQLARLMGMKTEDAQQIVDEKLEQLAKSLEAGHSETLSEVLRTMARFHKYSLGNVLLILNQNPDASRVAGFNAWKDLGRFVKSGEKGIAIFVPIQIKGVRDNDTSLFAYKSSAEVKEHLQSNPDAEVQSFTRFKVGYVFDVSQTDGAPLPELQTSTGDPKDFTQRLKGLVEQTNIHLSYEESLGGALGQSSGGEIKLLQGLNPAEEFHTLVHELAHELLHHGESRVGTTKTSRELEAEAIAFVVSEYIGLDTGSSSSDYIQLYKGDIQAFKKSLDAVRAVASRILESLQK